MNEVTSYHNDRTLVTWYQLILKDLPQALRTSKGLRETWFFDSKGHRRWKRIRNPVIPKVPSFRRDSLISQAVTQLSLKHPRQTYSEEANVPQSPGWVLWTSKSSLTNNVISLWTFISQLPLHSLYDHLITTRLFPWVPRPHAVAGDDH